MTLAQVNLRRNIHIPGLGGVQTLKNVEGELLAHGVRIVTPTCVVVLAWGDPVESVITEMLPRAKSAQEIQADAASMFAHMELAPQGNHADGLAQQVAASMPQGQGHGQALSESAAAQAQQAANRQPPPPPKKGGRK